MLRLSLCRPRGLDAEFLAIEIGLASFVTKLGKLLISRMTNAPSLRPAEDDTQIQGLGSRRPAYSGQARRYLYYWREYSFFLSTFQLPTVPNPFSTCIFLFAPSLPSPCLGSSQLSHPSTTSIGDSYSLESRIRHPTRSLRRAVSLSRNSSSITSSSTRKGILLQLVGADS